MVFLQEVITSMIVRNFGQGWFKDGEGVYQGSYEYNGNLMFR